MMVNQHFVVFCSLLTEWPFEHGLLVNAFMTVYNVDTIEQSDDYLQGCA